MKTQRDKINLLIQTAGFFNSTNRSSNKDFKSQSCLYNNPNSNLPGCAVGRLINDTKLKEKMDKSSNSGVCEPEIWNLIPKDVRDWGQEFLCELQGFHDVTQNWEDNGMSDRGIGKFNEIKEKITCGDFNADRFGKCVVTRNKA